MQENLIELLYFILFYLFWNTQVRNFNLKKIQTSQILAIHC